MYPGTHAQTTPDKPAVILTASGEHLTYRELADRSAVLASALHALGLRAGDGIAVITDNTIEIFEIYWAAIQSGLVITPVNRHLAVDEAEYIVTDCDAKVLFVSAALRDLGASLRKRLPSLEHAYSFGGEIEGYNAYRTLLESEAAPPAERPRGTEMMYSSGTTGRPKGVKTPALPISVEEPGEPLSAFLSGSLGLGPEVVYLQPAPIYHAAPLKWSAAVHSLGGTVVMMEKFDSRRALHAIEQYKINVAQFVPTMFVRMLQLPESVRAGYDVSSLKHAVHSAAPCPPDVKQAMIDWFGPNLLEYYASTEGAGMTVIDSHEWSAKKGSVGRAVIGKIHVCDDDGAEVPAGAVGAIYFERDTVPFEYHKDSEKTAASVNPIHSTWTTFGDIGYQDADGFLFLTDRKAFVIISGGVNIYPQEIENVLTLHESIFDVAVIGVPDPEMGQSVKAVVQLKDGIDASEDLASEIIRYTRERIAHFKAPRSVDFVDELPRTPTGKLLKAKLDQTYRATSKVLAS